MTRSPPPADVAALQAGISIVACLTLDLVIGLVTLHEVGPWTPAWAVWGFVVHPALLLGCLVSLSNPTDDTSQDRSPEVTR